jgi:hypothetical protein
VPRSLERGSDETHFRERAVRQVLRVGPDSTELSLDEETHDLSQGLLLNEYFWLAPGHRQTCHVHSSPKERTFVKAVVTSASFGLTLGWLLRKRMPEEKT